MLSRAQDLAAWSKLFKNAKTFGNYLAHIRLVCDLLGLPHESTRHTLVTRARVALEKRQGPPKPKRFLRWEIVHRLVEYAALEGDQVSAMLYIAAYVFLARVPS